MVQPIPAVLVATLGAEPQIAPLAVQLLRAGGVEIERIQVVHTNPALPPIRQSLERLVQIVAQEPWLPPLERVQALCDDVLTSGQMAVFEEAVFTCLQAHVRQGTQVHLLLAGGRKSAALVSLTVAQLLLGPQDRVWHLYSDQALLRSGRHRLQPGDKAMLLPIPLPPPLVEPALGPVAQAASPVDARQRLADHAQEVRRRFLEQTLSPAERQVALLAARELLTVVQMAKRLQKSPKTVTNQLNQVYRNLETHLGREIDVGLRRETLRQFLGPLLGG